MAAKQTQFSPLALTIIFLLLGGMGTAMFFGLKADTKLTAKETTVETVEQMFKNVIDNQEQMLLNQKNGTPYDRKQDKKFNAKIDTLRNELGFSSKRDR